ncbi:MAG: putative immunity protein [Candidatus Bathyarchaeia archaeon]
MRDKRFVAEHRGGPLPKEQHFQLLQWACDCTEHVLCFLGDSVDDRIQNALTVAKEWIIGKATVGDDRRASVDAIHAARQLIDACAIAIARSAGHAVATAHMAEHSLGVAWYALKALKVPVNQLRKKENGRMNDCQWKSRTSSKALGKQRGFECMDGPRTSTPLHSMQHRR